MASTEDFSVGRGRSLSFRPDRFRSAGQRTRFPAVKSDLCRSPQFVVNRQSTDRARIGMPLGRRTAYSYMTSKEFLRG